MKVMKHFNINDMSIVKSFSFPDGEIRGDMFYIKHVSNNFTVIDCYLTDEAGANGRKDELIAEVKSESNGRTCRFISTHPDHDHIAGIEFLNDEWSILNFYAVENNHPKDESDDSLTTYQWLLRNKNYPISRGIKRKWLNDSSDERGSSGINFLWPDLKNEKFQAALAKVEEGKEINNICPIFTYSVTDGPVYMWMGDLETKMQKAFFDEYKDVVPHVDILFQPHHGRESGAVPTDLLEALSPKLIIIGNAPAKHIDYGDSQCTITQNTSGDIMFENDGRKIHVYTKNKIDNLPACLKKMTGRTNKYGKMFVVEWYYAGTLNLD